MVDYANWPVRVDYASKHRRLKPIPSPWINPKKVSEPLQRLLERFAKSILVLSYRSDGIPGRTELTRLMKRVKRDVRIYEPPHRYQYVLSTNRRARSYCWLGCRRTVLMNGQVISEPTNTGKMNWMRVKGVPTPLRCLRPHRNERSRRTPPHAFPTIQCNRDDPRQDGHGQYAHNAPSGTLTPNAEKMNHADMRCADWNTTRGKEPYLPGRRRVAERANQLAIASRSREGKGGCPRLLRTEKSSARSTATTMLPGNEELPRGRTLGGSDAGTDRSMRAMMLMPL